MKESRWSPDLPARLYWTLPLFLFVITVGFEVVEVLVLEGEGIQGLLESAHLAEITFFTVLCALLGLACTDSATIWRLEPRLNATSAGGTGN